MAVGGSRQVLECWGSIWVHGPCSINHIRNEYMDAIADTPEAGGRGGPRMGRREDALSERTALAPPPADRAAIARNYGSTTIVLGNWVRALYDGTVYMLRSSLCVLVELAHHQ